MPEQRKFERLPAQLDVEIRTRGRGRICPSIHVSRHGMFLATDNPPQERQLLILRIPLPDHLPPIDVMASVIRRAPPKEALGTGAKGAQAEAPEIGMGINFFALTEENKQRWERYLARLRGQTPRASRPSVNSQRPIFLLQPKDPDRLRLFEAREFALGSMFLRTPVLRSEGEQLNVVLLHPLSDEEFPLLARVRVVHEGGGTEAKGMTLDFEALEHKLRVAFHTFVEHGTGREETVDLDRSSTHDLRQVLPPPLPTARRNPEPGAAPFGEHATAREEPKPFAAAFPVPPPPPPGALLETEGDASAEAASPALERAAGFDDSFLQRLSDLPASEQLRHQRAEDAELEASAAPLAAHGDGRPPEAMAPLDLAEDRTILSHVAASAAAAHPAAPPSNPPPEGDHSLAGAHGLATPLEPAATLPAAIAEPAATAERGEVEAPPQAAAPARPAPFAHPSAAEPTALTALGESGLDASDAPAKPDPTLEPLRAALERAPDDVSLLFRLGNQLARKPATAFEAISVLQHLIALEPQHPHANGALALAYPQIGQRCADERNLSRARWLGLAVDAELKRLLA